MMMTDDEIDAFLEERKHERDRDMFFKEMMAKARNIVEQLPEYKETA